MSAYVRSKAIAERAAWDFMAAEGGELELSTINPAGIFGPVLGADARSSIELVTRLMRGMRPRRLWSASGTAGAVNGVV